MLGRDRTLWCKTLVSKSPLSNTNPSATLAFNECNYMHMPYFPHGWNLFINYFLLGNAAAGSRLGWQLNLWLSATLSKDDTYGESIAFCGNCVRRPFNVLERAEGLQRRAFRKSLSVHLVHYLDTISGARWTVLCDKRRNLLIGFDNVTILLV